MTAAVLEAQRFSSRAFEAFGFGVTISEAAARYALAALRESDMGVRGLIGVLRRAADAALIELVSSGSSQGTRRVIGPDDVGQLQ